MKNHRVVAIMLLAVAALTLAVFLISLIQPILPPSINSCLILFIASFIGVLGFLAMSNEAIEFFQKLRGDKRSLLHDKQNKVTEELKIPNLELSLYQSEERTYRKEIWFFRH